MKPASPLLLLAFPSLAMALPWGDADLRQGEQLHTQACVSCHARYYGGDGSGMYTRDQRQVTSAAALLQRTATCNSQTRSGWFPEDEAAVAAHLNHRHYHFKD